MTKNIINIKYQKKYHQYKLIKLTKERKVSLTNEKCFFTARPTYKEVIKEGVFRLPIQNKVIKEHCVHLKLNESK